MKQMGQEDAYFLQNKRFLTEETFSHDTLHVHVNGLCDNKSYFFIAESISY